MKNKTMNFLEYVQNLKNKYKEADWDKTMNFLEYVQNLKNKYKEADWDSYENCNTAKDIIFKATEFYNQPFSPDLIEKYFEGTKKREHSQWFYMKNGMIQFDEGSSVYNFVPHNAYPTCTFPIPKTLDAFITDCQRAGIELIFSPYSLSQLNLEK